MAGNYICLVLFQVLTICACDGLNSTSLEGKIGELCEPTSQRIIDNNPTLQPSKDWRTCDLAKKNYCQPKHPPTNPPTGLCAPQASFGGVCTTNAGCDPETEVDTNHVICSIRPGDISGKCGCPIDYMTDVEKADHVAQFGFTFERIDNGSKGCQKSVSSEKSCNPQTDVCGLFENERLICRKLGVKARESHCLFPFQSQNEGQHCLDDSDCTQLYNCVSNANDSTAINTCQCLSHTKSENGVCINKYVGFNVDCMTDEDCHPETGWDIICREKEGKKICTCRPSYDEFYQVGSQVRCYPTKNYSEQCHHNAIVTKEGKDHDCRRVNSVGVLTNLICINSQCACETNFYTWDSTNELCRQSYAFYSDPCDLPPGERVDRFKCHPKLRLQCHLIHRNCTCVPGAFLLSYLGRACQYRQQLRLLNDECDPTQDQICTPDLYLECQRGRCNCIEDDTVSNDGTRCVYSPVGHDHVISTASIKQFFSIPTFQSPFLALTLSLIITIFRN